MRPALEVADIFRHHGAAYRQAHAGHLSREQRRVMAAIEACRTAALGGHVEQCEGCGEIGKEAELAGIEGGLQTVEKQPAEQLFEHWHGQEKPGRAGHPAAAVERRSATGDDAMHMRMVMEVLPPGVEHRDGADRPDA